jgi:predicted SnoaL-like aldol condensation-catalyzing enzyme
MSDKAMATTLDAQKAAVAQIVAIFNTGDLSGVDALFSSEYSDHQKPAWLDAAGGEEFKAIVLSARASMPNLQVTIEALVAEEDMVVARLRWHSAEPNGKTIDRETIDMLRFVNGQVAEHWGAETWATETPPKG